MRGNQPHFEHVREHLLPTRIGAAAALSGGLQGRDSGAPYRPARQAPPLEYSADEMRLAAAEPHVRPGGEGVRLAHAAGEDQKAFLLDLIGPPRILDIPQR